MAPRHSRRRAPVRRLLECRVRRPTSVPQPAPSSAGLVVVQAREEAGEDLLARDLTLALRVVALLLERGGKSQQASTVEASKSVEAGVEIEEFLDCGMTRTGWVALARSRPPCHSAGPSRQRPRSTAEAATASRRRAAGPRGAAR